jgi:hypothetical protein
MGGIVCEAWMKPADQANKKITFLAVLTLILRMGCSMRWMGGILCEAWMKTADLTIKKDDFSRSSYTYPVSELQYGMDGWGVCRAMA